ncbi:MAG: heme-binding protein [Bacteroidia bacterium]|nr:MAG: heme-binding protein [Bacteroidia bacterium]
MNGANHPTIHHQNMKNNKKPVLHFTHFDISHIKNMKTTIILTVIFLTTMTGIRLWASESSRSIEEYPYTVLQSYPGFEVRLYEQAIFARTHIDAETYRSGSGNGFRTLASYIFGGNDRNEGIAMTAPVAMRWDDGMVMEFMMPSKYSLETLPAPNRGDIELYEKPAVIMAGLTFGGWANDRRIAQKIRELSDLLEEHGIRHNGQFQFFGYDSPYKMVNRRNDIVVQVEGWE